MSCIPSTTETTQNKGRRTYCNDNVCIQPNFTNHTYQTTNQTSTTQTTKTTTSTWVSPLTQNLCSYNWDNANSGVFIFKFQPISKIHIQSISYISCITNLYISSISKNLYMAYVARTKKLVNCCFSQNIAKHKLAAYLIYLCYFFSYLYKYIKDIGQIIWIFL